MNHKLFVDHQRKKSLIVGVFVFLTTFIGLGYVRFILNPPMYKATGKILSPSITADSSEITTNLSPDLGLIQSSFLAEKVLKDLDNGLSTNDLQKNLEVNQLAQGQILELSFINENPEQAALVVNIWMTKYLESKEENEEQSNKSLTSFLDEQLPKNEKKLSEAEAKLKQFQEKNNIIDANTEAQSVLQNIGDLELKLTSLQAQLQTYNLRKTSLQNLIQVDPQKANTASIISNSPATNSLLQQLEEIKIKIQQAKSIYNERHPEIINLRQEEQVLRTQLQSSLQQNSNTNRGININQNDLETVYQLGKSQQNLLVEYRTIEKKIIKIQQEINTTQNFIDNYKNRFTELRELELEEKKIKQEIATQQQLVDNLQANYEEAKLIQSKNQENELSLDFAEVPLKPLNSSLSEYIIQGIIAGLILSLLMMIIFNQSTNKNDQDNFFANK